MNVPSSARSGKSGYERITLYGSEEETGVKKHRAVTFEFPGLCAGEVSRQKEESSAEGQEDPAGCV